MVESQQASSQQTTPILRVFTTEPQSLKAARRLFWHRQTTVRNRAYALQESFYPTSDVLYAAVVQRMATLLGIFDRASVLSYLGRPRHVKADRIDQIVQYPRSGTTVQKIHTFKHKLPAKKGYIEALGLGYVYVVNDSWWIHWDHEAQTKLTSYQGEAVTEDIEPSTEDDPMSSVSSVNQGEGEAAFSSQGECVCEKVSKGDFSHVKIAAPASTAAIVAGDMSSAVKEEKKEGYSLCERNSGSESNRSMENSPPDSWLTPSEKAAIEERDRKRLQILDRKLLPRIEKTVKNRGESAR